MTSTLESIKDIQDKKLADDNEIYYMYHKRITFLKHWINRAPHYKDRYEAEIKECQQEQVKLLKKYGNDTNPSVKHPFIHGELNA